MRAVLLALAFSALAAIPAFAQEAEVAAPAPADAGVHVTSAQAGETVNATAGDNIVVELIGSPSSGMTWVVPEQPAFLGAPQTFTGPTTVAQQRPGFVGGPRWQVYVFPVSESGTGALRLEMRNARDRNAAPSETFEVNIDAH